MSDLVGDNFLNLLEALQECNCTSLPKVCDVTTLRIRDL